MNLIPQNEFFKKYKINPDDFKKYGLDWDELTEIYRDFISISPTLQTVSLTSATILRDNPDVHSVRTRVKDPEHLIEKIIRKTIEKNLENEQDYKITKENYRSLITDLIGIRVLHLYKEQAIEIDKMIRSNWEPCETPIIYKRDGDVDIDYVVKNKDLFDPKIHPAGYRSWHYLIKQNVTKIETIAEVQVRTIFEEGWSEVDHQLRYPSDLKNELLNNQLLVLNRLAGNADEMVNTIRESKIKLADMNEEKEEQQSIINDLRKEIEALYKDKEIKEDQMVSLQDKISKLEESQNRSYISSNILGSAINITNNSLSSSIFSNETASVNVGTNIIYSSISDNYLTQKTNNGTLSKIINKSVNNIKE